jgi:predicted DNA-binding transcriptional regulator AlpA
VRQAENFIVGSSIVGKGFPTAIKLGKRMAFRRSSLDKWLAELEKQAG